MREQVRPAGAGDFQAAGPVPSGRQSDIPTNVTPPAGFVPPEPDELARQFPQLEILDAGSPGGTRKSAIGSFVPGLVSLLFASFNPGLAGGFVLVLPD